MGDDADLFSSATDNAATVEDGGDDLLGGDFQASSNSHEGQFESSFPAIDTSNEVCFVFDPFHALACQMTLSPITHAIRNHRQ